MWYGEKGLELALVWFCVNKMNQPLLCVLCEASLMWVLGLLIWTPCGPAVLFEDSWILGNEELFIQSSTQRAGIFWYIGIFGGIWYIFPPPAYFF